MFSVGAALAAAVGRVPPAKENGDDEARRKQEKPVVHAGLAVELLVSALGSSSVAHRRGGSGRRGGRGPGSGRARVHTCLPPKHHNAVRHIGLRCV